MKYLEVTPGRQMSISKSNMSLRHSLPSPPPPPPHTHKHTHTHTHKENILSSSAANTPNNPHLHSPPAALDISYEGSQNTFKREIVKYVFFSLLNYL